MHEGVYLGFDFGFKRIGIAVGQTLTLSANPLPYLSAENGTPDWQQIEKLIKTWRPVGLVVGIPTCINDSKLYTTDAAKAFATKLAERYHLPTYGVDERLSTKEARSRLFNEGGYKNLKKGLIDSAAACIILEQWFAFPTEVLTST